MNTIRLQQYVGDDGILKLEVPAGITQRTLDVLVVLHPLATTPVELDERGWPVGFFERLDSIEADDVVERGAQPPLDVRDEME